ncbi:unnamed protein product [Symbiodinium sp. CCMP2592]|nr:unnamed protein product [Symbiodinium sp. CCMP2592]
MWSSRLGLWPFWPLWPLAMAAEYGPPGDPTCWLGNINFETCCLPPPRGNENCWEGGFTYERCCRRNPHEPVDINKVAEISELGGCELNIFQEFKERAGAWYRAYVPNLVLFQEFGYISRRFDSMYRSCAPAALTALLLKLESIYFEEESIWTPLYAHYAEQHHQAVANGDLLQSHHINGWPLVEALKRVNALRASREPRLEAPVTPVLDIVLCYCGRGERIDWLRGFHKLPWRNENRSASTTARVALRFYHKCGAMGDEQRQEETSKLKDEWSDYFHTVEVRYVDDQVRADDCSAYLAYVVDRYDDLPEFAVFLHADAPEHIPSVDLLMDAVFAASRGFLPEEAGFIHLAHNYVRHDCPGNRTECKDPDAPEVARLWRKVFHSSIAPTRLEGHMNGYCCVQFLVRRERIQLRTKQFYVDALNFFGETAESYYELFPVGKVIWTPDTRGRTPCQLAMYFWHVIFGEDLWLPRRHRDSRLPLFIRMLNIEAEAALEAQRGEDGAGGRVIQFTGDNTGAEDTYYRLQSLFTAQKPASLRQTAERLCEQALQAAKKALVDDVKPWEKQKARFTLVENQPSVMKLQTGKRASMKPSVRALTAVTPPRSESLERDRDRSAPASPARQRTAPKKINELDMQAGKS